MSDALNGSRETHGDMVTPTPSPRVLALMEWYLPGEKSGGPLRTVDALVQRFNGRVHFDVVSRDHDIGDRAPYPDLPAGVWLDGRPGRRRYLSRRDERPLAMLRLLRRTSPDTLYLHTLFSGPFALYPLIFRRLGLLRCRVVVAPQGQLHEGALAFHPVKKRAYLTALRALSLLGGIEWHASSEHEEADIRRLVPNAMIHVAPNLRRPALVPVGTPSPAGTVRAVFLSRIDNKKNLDGALRILARCTSPIVFDIYGPRGEDEYWDTCRRLIRSLPDNVTCAYRGVVGHDDVSSVFNAYDLLLLPTHGENFGHVIGEALEAGCLALVSDRTPWLDLIEAEAGWDLPLDDPQAFAEAIEEYARLNEAQRILHRTRARDFAARHDGDPGHVAANLRLLSGDKRE